MGSLTTIEKNNKVDAKCRRLSRTVQNDPVQSRRQRWDEQFTVRYVNARLSVPGNKNTKIAHFASFEYLLPLSEKTFKFMGIQQTKNLLCTVNCVNVPVEYFQLHAAAASTLTRM